MMKAKEIGNNMLKWILNEQEDWVFELKIDGSRTFWDRDRLLSSRLVDCSIRFKHIANELKYTNAIIDGEIALPNGNVLELNKSENWNKAKYYVFDILELDYQDTKGYPLFERQKILRELIDGMENVEFIKQFNSFNEGWNYVKENNLEGLVIKRKDSIYLSNLYTEMRTNSWLKIKNWKEEKLRIVGFEEGDVKGAFILENGSRVSALRSDLGKLFSDGCRLEAEIIYMGKTQGNSLFQPVLKRLFKDGELIFELESKEAIV